MWGKRVYMDYAGATPASKAALKAFQESLKEWANPSALHHEGSLAKESLGRARQRVARVLECKEGEVVFTSGGTEGNNLAIRGVVGTALADRSMTAVHIVTTAIEHASVLEPIAVLERAGARVTRLAPDPFGRISAKEVAEALTPSTVLVSIGWANSEVGTVQQMGAIAKAIRGYESERSHKIVFHSDAGQAPLYLPAVIAGLGVDILTLDAGKLYGVRGCGALFVRRGVSLAPIMYGGGQEGGMRPGTENVALAHALGAAMEEARAEREHEVNRLLEIRKVFIDALQEKMPDAVINGKNDRTLPHIVNVSVPGIDAEYVVLRMDKNGVAIATKSACEEGEQDSHVVKAMMGEEGAWRARTTLRFSFGSDTTARNVHRAVDVLLEAVELSRKVDKDKK